MDENPIAKRIRDLEDSAVNACKTINPDNPQAVADNLVGLMEAALWLIIRRVEDDEGVDYYGEWDILGDVLSKIQAKEPTP